MTTTRERMTKERLDTTVLAMLRDDVTMRGPFDQTVREVVPLEAALAYGADERVAGVIEGMERSARAMCVYCGGKVPHWVATVELYKQQSYRHYDTDHQGSINCAAGPIHDAIQAMRGERSCE